MSIADDDFKARILAASPGEIVTLPPGWTILDFVNWVAAGNLDEVLEQSRGLLLKERTELN